MQDDSVSTAELVGALRPEGPHPFPSAAGEVAARKTPQSTLLWHCAVYQTLRGHYTHEYKRLINTFPWQWTDDHKWSFLLPGPSRCPSTDKSRDPWGATREKGVFTSLLLFPVSVLVPLCLHLAALRGHHCWDYTNVVMQLFDLRSFYLMLLEPFLGGGLVQKLGKLYHVVGGRSR